MKAGANLRIRWNGNEEGGRPEAWGPSREGQVYCVLRRRSWKGRCQPVVPDNSREKRCYKQYQKVPEISSLK